MENPIYKMPRDDLSETSTSSEDFYPFPSSGKRGVIQPPADSARSRALQQRGQGVQGSTEPEDKAKMMVGLSVGKN